MNNHDVHSVESLVKNSLRISDQSKCFYDNEKTLSFIRESLHYMKIQFSQNKRSIIEIITGNYENFIFNTLEIIASIYTYLEYISKMSKNTNELIKDYITQKFLKK